MTESLNYPCHDKAKNDTDADTETKGAHDLILGVRHVHYLHGGRTVVAAAE